MLKENQRHSPIELADLILEYNPGASTEMIASVVSQWGDLFDDRQNEFENARKTNNAASMAQDLGQQTYCPHLPTHRGA